MPHLTSALPSSSSSSTIAPVVPAPAFAPVEAQRLTLRSGDSVLLVPAEPAAVAELTLRDRFAAFVDRWIYLAVAGLVLAFLLAGCYAVSTHGVELTWADIVAGARSLRLK